LAGALQFATALYTRRLTDAYHRTVWRDPMAQLRGRAGRDDPYPIYERVRARGTVVATRLGNFITPSHRVCNFVLRDRRFGVRSGERVNTADEFDMSFLDMDPPDHTRLRRLAQPFFSPKLMSGYRSRVTSQVDALLDAALAKGSFDLVSSFAAPLPIAVITDLLGVPDADAAQFSSVGTVIGSALSGIRSLRHAAQLKAADEVLRTLFSSLFELRRQSPADDVISHLVAAPGDQVHPSELRPMCTLLLVAGFETTVNLIGNAVNALLAHPAQWRDLCDDPSLAAAAIEETLRWDPPVQRTARCASEDIAIDGVPIRRGQYIVTMLAAANRDPEVFARAAEFDIHRTPEADHLAFSSGIHYCVGAPLARMEATIGLQRLAERLPGLARAGALRRRTSGIVRGPIHFPVRATPSAGYAAAHG
jgi:P450-derived glycosyltransferase activator